MPVAIRALTVVRAVRAVRAVSAGIVAVSVVVGAGLVVAGAALADRPTPAAPNPLAYARYLVFEASLPAFLGIADDPARDPRLDWTSDGCSAPVLGDSGLSFNFRNPCRRHDFAYRNFARLNGGLIWTPTMRRRVDDVFLRDMRQTCHQRQWMVAIRCLGWAETYYRSVRMFAGV